MSHSAPYTVRGVAIPGGLVHPHIHLDKCYLLDKTPVQEGTFKEALLRTGEAKVGFEEPDLLERGRRLIATSLHHGVLAMRCHVEVDATVGHKCLVAGEKLKAEFSGRCDVQLVAFAQDRLLYPNDERMQAKMLELLIGACQHRNVAVLGSAPYVEQCLPNEADNYSAQQANVRIMFDLAAKFDKDLDFHLDYNLDQQAEPMLWFVLEEAHRHRWTRGLTIGHATRISLFKQEDYARLQRLSQGLRISFVGLPSSDLYMQGRDVVYAQRTRATLPLLELALRDFDVGLGVNNVGNLFTPQGDGDPLALLPFVVALWQTAKPADLASILAMVSSTARKLIGLNDGTQLEPVEIEVEVRSDGTVRSDLPHGASTFTLLAGCKSVQDAVLAPPAARLTVRDGRLVAWRRVDEGIAPL